MSELMEGAPTLNLAELEAMSLTDVRRCAAELGLTAISTLRSLFNRDNGHPRLVLIFSPT